MAKENQLIIQLRGFDAKHYTRTERYAKQVAKLYQTAADEFASLAGKINLPAGGTFNFDDFPKAKKQARGIVTRLAGKIEAVVTSGQRSEWLAACQKNDAFLASILRTSKLTKEEAERYQARNLEALSAFQKRKENGLNLSQRVWKYAEELKDAMELGIDVGLGEGKSAQQLSRDLRQYLNEPDRLYRRVRDKGGNLRLSKAAKMYHPGQGVYRSSAKNAQRLTRTEINMAYRESEYLRWQQLDFIVGIRVMLSNNHTIKNSKGEPVPFVDICDTLAGDYPKTFKFVGWHPQCRCFAVPIMADYDEYNKNRANRLKAIVKGAQYKSLPSRRTVKDVPKAFRDYISSIEERAKGWKSMPYYIRDNFNGGKISGGLKTGIASKAMNTVEPCTDFDSDIAYYKRWAYSFGLDVSSLDTLRNSGNRAALTGEIDKVDNVLLQRKREWLRAISDLRDFIEKDMKGFADLQKEYTNIINANEVHTSNYYGDCITKLQQALSKAKTDLQKAKAEVAKGGDNPHPALRTAYTSDIQVDETFAKINKELTEKWFENGDLKLTPTRRTGVNGFTYMDGRLSLTPDRLAGVKSALAKIATRHSADITKGEADAMATFWHEITHNRNKPGNMYLTDTQRRYMELANEFVSRKTLPEFYKKLGCSKTPYPEFITNRNSTGYNTMVNNYDWVISNFVLDANKVLATVKRNLYNEVYSDQLTGLKQGLLDGGLKRLDGKKVSKSDLNNILKCCCCGRATLENWLKQNGYMN